MSKIVLVGGVKGGTGKSTIATNLASMRIQKAGHNNLLLVDTDSQASTADWAYYRTSKGIGGIECIQLFEKRIISELKSKIDRYDDIIIDAGGRDSKELRYSMTACDVALFPFGASQRDLNTAENVEEVVSQVRTVNSGLKCYSFINKLKNHASLTEGEDAIEFLRRYDEWETLDSIIHDRISFSRTGSEGRGVSEMMNGKGQLVDEKAVAELTKIYEVIYE